MRKLTFSFALYNFIESIIRSDRLIIKYTEFCTNFFSVRNLFSSQKPGLITAIRIYGKSLLAFFYRDSNARALKTIIKFNSVSCVCVF